MVQSDGDGHSTREVRGYVEGGGKLQKRLALRRRDSLDHPPAHFGRAPPGDSELAAPETSAQ